MSGPAAVADVPPDWGTVLPKADVSAGSQVAQKCQSCHNFQQGGPNMTGPNLYGVVGRGIGSHPGYDYDQPMKDFAAKNPVWTYNLLYTYLKTPGTIVAGHEDDLRRAALAGRPDQHHRLSALPGLDPAGAGAASSGRGRVQRAGQRRSGGRGEQRGGVRRLCRLVGGGGLVGPSAKLAQQPSL